MADGSEWMGFPDRLRHAAVPQPRHQRLDHDRLAGHLSPPRLRLADLLASMPDVGNDADLGRL
jgi:hypothetical protein